MLILLCSTFIEKTINSIKYKQIILFRIIVNDITIYNFLEKSFIVKNFFIRIFSMKSGCHSDSLTTLPFLISCVEELRILSSLSKGAFSATQLSF